MTNPSSRRKVRQRTDFKVKGERSGREVKIANSSTYELPLSEYSIVSTSITRKLIPLFEHEFGMCAFGGYIKTERQVQLSYSLHVSQKNADQIIDSAEARISITPHSWFKFGIELIIDTLPPLNEVDISYKLHLISPIADEPIGKVHFMGIACDVVSAFSTLTVEQEFGPMVWEKFNINTSLYRPEIYYLQHEDELQIPALQYQRVKGEQIVLKACNRCSRFLPIDIKSEDNTLSFSRHARFSRFIVVNKDEINIDDDLMRFIQPIDDKLIIVSNRGFQLECRSCKKFVVNAALNPARNSAQRREDGARRRAFEKLARKLLDISEGQWIFYSFRQAVTNKEKEFDTYIWEKFNKRCFACGTPLPKTTDMALDHTLPLAYLWPLNETATCLCTTCNSQKRENFPFEFNLYKAPGKIEALAEITGIPLDILKTQKRFVNPAALNKLTARIVWFFDEFLAEDDYQKIRDGKKTADLILASLQRVLTQGGTDLLLVDRYIAITGKRPATITEIINQTEVDIDDL